MITRRSVVVALGAIPLALPRLSGAQAPAATIARIGFVSGRGGPPDPSADAFREGLRQLGYVEGKNVRIEYRYFADKLNDIPAVVADLRRMNVEVLVSPTARVMVAAQQATQTTPIVIVIASDPVQAGLVASLARPGGNITGIHRLRAELGGKRVELLKELAPGLARIAVIWDAEEPAAVLASKEYIAAARALKVDLVPLEVRGPKGDLERAFETAVKAQAGAVAAVSTTLLLSNSKRFADLAIKYRLPSMVEGAEMAQAGGLISYASNDAAGFRRAAVYVDKILKGARPGDLPIEQARDFELILNMKTAKMIGISISQSILLRADRLIE